MKHSEFAPARKSALFVVFAAAFLTGLYATPAQADFTGPYADTPAPASYYDQSGQLDAPFGTWFLSGSNYHFFALEINTSLDSVTFNSGYAEDDGGGDQLILMFNNTAAADGLLSFNYHLVAANPYNDDAAYTVNGVFTMLAAGDGSVGGVTLHVGDVFGFYVTAGPQELAKQISSDTALTVTNFAAPVPEPATCAWLALGLAVGGWCLLRAHLGR